MGVTRTQVVKYARNSKGEKGAVLRGPQAWSDCATGYAFQAGGAGEEWKDVVLYNGNYYSCVKTHTKTTSNYPGSAADQSAGLWQLGDNIELVATKILLATYALVENLGVETIDMRDSSGNILFQAKDGAVTCNTGNFNNITVKNGLFYGSLATPPQTIANNSTALTLSFDTGFNFSGTLSSGLTKTITLPTGTAYAGVECSIINYGGSSAGYYIIKTASGANFLYTGKYDSINSLSTIHLHGVSELRLKAVLVSGVLRWFVINHKDFSYNYKDKVLTNKIARPDVKCIGAYTVTNGTTLTTELCTDGNTLTMTQVQTGVWKFTFASTRKDKNYMIVEANNTTAGRVQSYSIGTGSFNLMCAIYLVVATTGDWYYYNPASYRFFILEYDL